MARTSRRLKSCAQRSLARCESLEARQLLTIAVTAVLPDLSGAALQEAIQVNLSKYFSEPAPGANIAFFSTTFGVIPVQLTPATTPKTVANFESYVNKGAYNGLIVGESQPGSFFLAGNYNISTTGNAPGQINVVTADAPVPSEAGASNVRGTIATALVTTDPNSATSAFIFNETDSNASTFDPEKLTVFGNIIGSAGLAVMDQIAAVPVPNPGPISTLPTLPVINYTPGGQAAFNQFVRISSVTIGADGFAASSDNPAVADVIVTGDTMAVSPLAAGTAHITVTAVGSDGAPVSQTFGVTVGASLPATPVTPAVKGALPASLIAGQPAKIRLGVSLTAGQDITSTAQTALRLTPNTSFGVQYTIATAQSNLKLKSGKHATLKLSATQIPADLLPGTYIVTVAVTAANSEQNEIATGQTVTIGPPQVNLGGSFKKLVTKAKAGKKDAASFVVTNTGNTTASGLLKLNVTKSTDGSLLEAPSKNVSIKPGKSVTIPLSWTAGSAGEQYFVDVAIDPANVFSDTTLLNNTVVSASAVTVG